MTRPDPRWEHSENTVRHRRGHGLCLHRKKAPALGHMCVCRWGRGGVLSWRKVPAPRFQKAQTTAELTSGASLRATVWPPWRVVWGFSVGTADRDNSSTWGWCEREGLARQGESPASSGHAIRLPTNLEPRPSSQCAGPPGKSPHLPVRLPAPSAVKRG